MDAYILYLGLIMLVVAQISGKVTLQCPEGYFLCDKDRCLGVDNVCDGVIHCDDGSDEICKEPEKQDVVDSKSAAVAAARYLISRMNSGWDDFAPRIAIAVSFLGPLSPLSLQDKHALVEKLNLQLLMLLKKGIQHMKLATLALYINAFYSICQDPRRYYANDLVELLRVEADRLKDNLNLPVVAILTLCIANEVRFEELNTLIKIYDDRRNFRIGNKALTLIVMAACQRAGTAEHFRAMEKRMQDFVQRHSNRQNIGPYSKALIYQAYNAWGLSTSQLQSELLQLQAADGSFQNDALATYAAIPALMNTSLANLQCKTANWGKPTRRTGTAVQLFNPQRYVEYTMSIPCGQENVGNHSLTVNFEGRKTLFEIMKTAENVNSIFKFTYDNVEGTGIKVTSLGGISNDAESGLAWTLYKKSPDQSSGKDYIESSELDLVYPQDGSHYIFKFE